MKRITDPSFEYTNSASTDIRRTFARHGFYAKSNTLKEKLLTIANFYGNEVRFDRAQFEAVINGEQE